eukprot:TRINITY_DN1020_c1_g1_i4.p1 TRINITY_DN1020_c1_g1~~TRINITY_DN1020_c1_g1_i4.p1  ORF type:complete len:148 (-),score=19.27 TRINITY_DN1020_c1_g1_i4:12-455(-)
MEEGLDGLVHTKDVVYLFQMTVAKQHATVVWSLKWIAESLTTAKRLDSLQEKDDYVTSNQEAQAALEKERELQLEKEYGVLEEAAKRKRSDYTREPTKKVRKDTRPVYFIFLMPQSTKDRFTPDLPAKSLQWLIPAVLDQDFISLHE